MKKITLTTFAWILVILLLIGMIWGCGNSLFKDIEKEEEKAENFCNSQGYAGVEYIYMNKLDIRPFKFKCYKYNETGFIEYSGERFIE